MDCGLFGLQMDVNGQEVWFKLIGNFNAYNLLAVYGTAHAFGRKLRKCLNDSFRTQNHLLVVFEQILAADRRVGIVDYAHTPDALENVLETIKDLREGNQKSDNGGRLWWK